MVTLGRVVFQFQGDQPAEVVQQGGVLYWVAAGVRQQGAVTGPGDGHLGGLLTWAFGVGRTPPGGLPTLGKCLAAVQVAHFQGPADAAFQRGDAGVEGAAGAQRLPVHVVQPPDGGQPLAFGLDGAFDDGAREGDELQVEAGGQHREVALVGRVQELRGHLGGAGFEGDHQAADAAVDELGDPWRLPGRVSRQSPAGGHDHVPGLEPAPGIGQVAGVRPGDRSRAAAGPGQVAQAQRRYGHQTVDGDHRAPLIRVASYECMTRAAKCVRRAHVPGRVQEPRLGAMEPAGGSDGARPQANRA